MLRKQHFNLYVPSEISVNFPVVRLFHIFKTPFTKYLPSLMFFILFLFCRAPNNDYSPENLQTVNDVVYLNLFDEVVFNILQVRNEFYTAAVL